MIAEDIFCAFNMLWQLDLSHVSSSSRHPAPPFLHPSTRLLLHTDCGRGLVARPSILSLSMPLPPNSSIYIPPLYICLPPPLSLIPPLGASSRPPSLHLLPFFLLRVQLQNEAFRVQLQFFFLGYSYKMKLLGYSYKTKLLGYSYKIKRQHPAAVVRGHICGSIKALVRL